MKAIRAIVRGIAAALSRPGLLAVLAIVDLTVGLVAVAPSYAALDGALSMRTDTPELARGFDFVAWLDVLSSDAWARTTWPWALAAALVFGWLWGALSAAGWLHADVRRGFWAGIGVLGFRFVRLAVVSAACLVVLELGRSALAEPLDHWADESTRATLAFSAKIALAAVHAFLVLVVLVVSDVAKVRIRAENRRSALLAFGSALRWVAGRPFSALAIGLIGAGLQLGLLFAAGAATDRTLGPTAAGFLVPFAAGQLFVALRIAVRAGTLLGLSRLFEAEDIELETIV